MAFWALGGGTADKPASTSGQTAGGLNQELPAPQLTETSPLSKFSLYQEAQRAAARSKTSGTPSLLQAGGPAMLEREAPFLDSAGTNRLLSPEQSEAQVNERLAKLTAMVQQAPPPPGPGSQPVRPPAAPDRFSQDVAKLEMLMRHMSPGASGQGDDPEIQRIENMLERILDIQHPERLQKKQALPDTSPSHGHHPPGMAAISQLGGSETHALPANPSPDTGFHGIDTPPSATGADPTSPALAAAIHETQTVVAGGIVKMRLLEEYRVGGRILPKGSLVYGTCRVGGERLLIDVRSVTTQQTVLPVALSAYDLDGMEGLYIPGSISRDAARQGTSQAISQSLQFPVLTPSLGSQAAGAGIAAAQGLLSRKARLVKVTLQAGHALLLRDQQRRP